MNCPYTWKIRLVFHHSPFTIHHSPFTIHHSPFTIHHSPFTIHHSPFTIHHSPFTIHHSPFTIHHSPFTVFFLQKRLPQLPRFRIFGTAVGVQYPERDVRLRGIGRQLLCPEEVRLRPFPRLRHAEIVPHPVAGPEQPEQLRIVGIFAP